MKVVVEFVFLENFLINLLEIKTTSILSHEKCSLAWVSAALGAAFCVILPALRLLSIGYLLVQVALVTLSLCISFKFKTFKKFVFLFVCHFITNFVYGGACEFFISLFGAKSLVVVLLVAVGMFLGISYVSKKINRKKRLENFSFKIEISMAGKTSRWNAFLDSGNQLSDPVTGCPVSLINFKVFTSIFSEIGLEDVLRRSDKIQKLPLAHYINLSTLSADDKILVFQADKLCIGTNIIQKPVLGLCLKGFSQLGSDVILNSSVHSFCA